MEIKINTKYDLGQEVYTLYNNKIRQTRVVEIYSPTFIDNKGVSTKPKYLLIGLSDNLSIGYKEENLIFHSKEELLNSIECL